MPELVTSVQAALIGAPGIAVGNIVGSNIANVLLVAAVPALFLTYQAGGSGQGRAIIARDLIPVSAAAAGYRGASTFDRA